MKISNRDLTTNGRPPATELAIDRARQLREENRRRTILAQYHAGLISGRELLHCHGIDVDA